MDEQHNKQQHKEHLSQGTDRCVAGNKPGSFPPRSPLLIIIIIFNFNEYLNSL